MRKKSFFLPMFFVALCLGITSCFNNDDDDIVIDEEWKALNEKRFNDINKNEYSVLASESGGGNIYWIESDVITKSDIEPTLKIAIDGKPEFTDTVMIRYEGWYLDKDGKKVIFDSTENPSLISRLDHRYGASMTSDPNKQLVTSAVTPNTSTNYIVGFGVSTLLQDMKEGDEREVVIPYTLAYGSSGRTHTPSVTGASTHIIVPGYTTLWFRVKLFKIIPMKG